VGDTHVVDVHLSNLRRKLQHRAPELRFIHTVRGVGFRLSNDLLRAAEQQPEHEDDGRELISA
jgi:two-component system OmpR family response regulator